MQCSAEERCSAVEWRGGAVMNDVVEGCSGAVYAVVQRSEVMQWSDAEECSEVVVQCMQ